MRKASKRAAVAGALSVDICPQFINKPASDFGEVIKPGGITRIIGNEIHPGGPVANTGIAMHIFGIDPMLVAMTGNDDFGRMLSSMLREHAGPDSTAEIGISESTPTAYSIILSPNGLDRAILQNPGANDDFRAENVDFGRLSDCALLHFGHPSTMRHMYEDDGAQLAEIMKDAKDSGMLTSLDLCAIDPASDAADQNWRRILERVLPYTDFFVPSIGDIDEMLMPGETPDAARLAHISREMGASCVMIKCGTDGIYFSNADQPFFRRAEDVIGLPEGTLDSWASAQGSYPARIVKKEVSGLGAGDTSIAAYLSSLLRGADLDTALRLTTTEGALCVTEPSSFGGLRPFEEVLQQNS